jgi:hypothetical protein
MKWEGDVVACVEDMKNVYKYAGSRPLVVNGAQY